MKNHVVRDGDCLTSIAFENGFHWKTLWDHPENEKLKERRKDPFTLAPGDVVHVPDPRTAEFQCATTKHHVFRRPSVPAKLRLQILDDEGNPRAGVPYELEIDDKKVGSALKTDGDGWAQYPIPPNAARARILLEGGEEYHLFLGHLRPVEEVIGVQMRLANLGYYGGPLDDRLGRETVLALQAFQVDSDLAPTGDLDQATRDAVKHAFGG